jgi:hypothetical protein
LMYPVYMYRYMGEGAELRYCILRTVLSDRKGEFEGQWEN